MIVTGLDIASCTGISWVDPSRHPSTWRAIALEAEGDDPWAKASDFSLALRELLSDVPPDFVVIERPLGVVVEYERGRKEAAGDDVRRTINAKTTITLGGLAGAAIATLEGLGLPWAMISSATWRSAWFGKGRKPQSGDWKDYACEVARLHGIALPGTKKAARDAAESVGIAASWQRANLIVPRHQPAFMNLRANGARQPALEGI